MTKHWPAALLAAFLLVGCTSVKINTGPPTDEESTARSDTQAREFKTDWYSRLSHADPMGKVSLMNELINQLAVGYIRYGHNVADIWRDAQRDAGVPVPASDIIQMIERSTATDQPMIQAQTDMVEYGINEIVTNGVFRPEFIDDLNDYRDFFNEVYNGVFLPSGTLPDYLENLDNLDARRATFYDRILAETRED